MNIEVRRPTEEEIIIAEDWPEWSKEPSEFPWIYDELEMCLILDGSAEVVEKNGKSSSFSAGDWVVFPKGLECVWKVKKPLRKKYKFG